MDALRRLQTWYLAQCDGDWEHEHGLRIESLDNPGWSVTIPLSDTRLEQVAFAAVREQTTAPDWLMCRREELDSGPVWRGDGGPLMLEAILTHFLAWAGLHQSAS